MFVSCEEGRVCSVSAISSTPTFPRFTLRHAVLRAPFCGEANYSKAAAAAQGLFLRYRRATPHIAQSDATNAVPAPVSCRLSQSHGRHPGAGVRLHHSNILCGGSKNGAGAVCVQLHFPPAPHYIVPKASNVFSVQHTRHHQDRRGMAASGL